jgi:BON domain-containing protein
MEPLERRYFGEPRDRDVPRRRHEPRLGWMLAPGVDGGDTALVPGPYAGRGPRDYRRTDIRIHDDICQWMSDDPRLDARTIEVQVKNADVTLTGVVDDRRARRLAEDIAQAVPGVRDVFNNLKLRARHAS